MPVMPYRFLPPAVVAMAKPDYPQDQEQTSEPAGTPLKREQPDADAITRPVLNPLQRGLILLVRIYQWCISPFLGQNCRFYPTCSAYCIQAMEEHGVLKGFWLGLKRVSRCHPFCEGGVDPVPPRKATSNRSHDELNQQP